MSQDYETIKDNNYNVIGYITTESNGDQKIQDTNSQVLGYYRKYTNDTIDVNYHPIGSGNQLMRLLK